MGAIKQEMGRVKHGWTFIPKLLFSHGMAKGKGFQPTKIETTRWVLVGIAMVTPNLWASSLTGEKRC